MLNSGSIGHFLFQRSKNTLKNLSWMVVVMIATAGAAQPVQHLTAVQPGGMPGLPVLEGIQPVTNGMHVTWDGPSGYYQVYQASNNLKAPWTPLGRATNLLRSLTVTKLYSNAFFRVSGPAPKYAGSKACLSCHLSVCQYVTYTPHASAFSDPAFRAAGGQTNSSCLPCHTVGYGLPTGFALTNKNGVYSYNTALAGVQCENCHGPAASHASAPDDPTVIPRVEIAATVCGGCHSASHTTYANPPTFEEWSGSDHSAVTPGALSSMSASTNNISSCGRCHSGSVRLALINGLNPMSLTNDLNVAITCAVCHDPHQTNANPAQLRNPLSSTNYFTLATSDVFSNKYNANTNINLCGQCHNSRGAAWTDTSRAPHLSPQYNFLLGSIGELLTGSSTFNPGTHAGLPSSAMNSLSGTFYLTNQCTECHLQNDSSGGHDHSFAVTTDAVCYNCHVTDPEILEDDFLTPAISNNVVTLLTGLNRWAALKAPPSLQSNGVVAWEYTTPGGLTWQTNSAGVVTNWSLANPVNFTGPNAAGQALLTTNFPNILKIRFNLYLVLNDGSFGVHNPGLALSLLNSAQIWLTQALQ